MAHTKVTKTYSQNTGAANTFSYSGSFDTFKATEVVVELDNVALTYTASTINESASPREYTVDYTNKTVHIGGADLSSGTVVIKPETDLGSPTPRAEFTPGASITSADLNNNQKQLLRRAMEYEEQVMFKTGGTLTGDLTMGEDQTIIFEGATADAHETTLTVTDPTADRTITLPNVTGTVVTTGDTATVTATMMAANSVDSSELVDGSIDASHIASNAVTTAKIAANAITNAKIGDDAVTTAKIGDDTVSTALIQDAAVTTAKLADNSVAAAKLGTNSVTEAKIVDGQITSSKLAANSVTNAAIADDVIDSEHYVDGSIDHAHLANDCVDGDNIQDDVINSEHIAAGAVDLEHMSANSVDSDQYVDGSIDHVHLAADIIDGDNIQDDAVNSEHIASGAIDLDHMSANSVDSDQYVDGSIDNAHLADDAVGADELAANAVVNASVASGAAIDHNKLAAVSSGNVIVGNGSNVPTSVAMSGDVAIAAGGATTIQANAVEIGMIGCEQTTISDSDSHIPTSGAVVDYVAAQLAPIGGLEVIADDESFPNTIPSAGVVISISDAAGLQVNSSGVSTNGDTLDNSTVTINGFPSELRGGVGSNADPYVFQSGAGLMVQSTGSSQTYNYHQAMIRESDFVQLSDDINDFNNRYRIHSGEPSSNNDDGDMVWDTSANKMKVYDSTASAWKEVTSTGDFKFLVPVDAGTTTAATWDGSDTSFDLKETTNSGSAASVTNINQLIVSLNGVIQKPNTGSYSASEEGFYLTDSDTIRFCTAPASGSTAFIIQCGSAVSIPTPGDDTVSAAKIQTGAVSTAKLAADAVTGAKIADDAINSEHYTDGSIDTAHIAADQITGALIADDAVGAEHIEVLDAALQFGDSVKAQFGTGNDLEIYHDGTNTYQVNTTGSLVHRSTGEIYIQSDAGIRLTDVGANETFLKCIDDGAVELYHNNVKCVETDANGIWLKDDKRITFGDAPDGDLRYRSATSQLELTVTGAQNFQLNLGGEVGLKSICNGSNELYYDNSKKFETKSYGCNLVGNLHMTSADSQILKFGEGDDLQIYHDGSNSWIDDAGTGALKIRSQAGSVQILGTGSNENMAVFTENAGTELYYDNVRTFTTDTNGAVILGPEGGEARLYMYADEGDDNGDKVHLATDTSGNFRLRFYDGTNWNTQWLVQSDGTFKGGDGRKMYFGDSNDLEIYYDGTNNISYLNHTNGSGSLTLRGDDLKLQSNTGTENYINAGHNGAVSLYHDNTKVYTTNGFSGPSNGMLSGGSVLNLNTDEDGTGSDYFIRGSKNSTAVGGGNDVFWIYEDGDMYNVNGTFSQSSDIKLKENITDASSQWNDLKALKVRNFNFKPSTGYSTHTQIGMVAQEVATTCPGLITERVDLQKTTDSDGTVTETDTGETTKSIKLTVLYMKAVKALQEAMTRIETLEAKVAALEAG